MATTWQMRRGSEAENNAFTGAPGELTIDMTTRTIRVHDGVTVGGWRIFTQGNTLSAEAIFFDNTNAPFTGNNVQVVLEEVGTDLTALQTDTHTHTNKVTLDAITSEGSGDIITTAERTQYDSAVLDGANIGGGAGEVYSGTSTNTSSFRTINAGPNIVIDTDTSAPNAVTITATGTVGQSATLITYDPVGTDYVGTNVQTALNETDTRLKAVELFGTVPLGAIIEWSGSLAGIPPLWRLCAGGAAVNGIIIPDLTDRFIVGAGGSYAVGAVGGSATDPHTHQIVGSVNGHALTEAEMPSHRHDLTLANNGNPDGSNDRTGLPEYLLDPRVHGTKGNYGTYTGGNQAHNHAVSITSSASSNSDNRPPYYALAKIIYVGV